MMCCAEQISPKEVVSAKVVETCTSKGLAKPWLKLLSLRGFRVYFYYSWHIDSNIQSPLPSLPGKPPGPKRCSERGPSECNNFDGPRATGLAASPAACRLASGSSAPSLEAQRGINPSPFGEGGYWSTLLRTTLTTPLSDLVVYAKHVALCSCSSLPRDART